MPHNTTNSDTETHAVHRTLTIKMIILTLKQRPIKHIALNERAFTLIELLIVVAIIGILAAIAVPNFMNARIRAKISQAYSDIRTLAMAHEQFYLDRNTYPNESESDPWKRPRYEAGLFWLTTPIPYMTTVPLDPFRSQEDNLTTPRAYETGVFTQGTAVKGRQVAYCIFTVGPDLSENGIYSASPFKGVGYNTIGNTYSSSNGLTSLGDIYWYGGNPSVVEQLKIDGRIYNGAFPPNFRN